MSDARRTVALPPLVGEPAPAFALQDCDGRVFRYDAGFGKPLLLVFWAFWCDTWKATTRAIRQARLHPPFWKGNIWAVCTDGRWIHRLSVDPVAQQIYFPVLMDVGSKVSRRYAVDAIPTLVLIDQTGTVRWRLRGVPKPQWLEAAVEGLAEPASSSPMPLSLTFDDFPQRGDEQLLEVLRQLNLRVMLFSIGRNAERLPDLVRWAMQDGHVVGNHSYSHRQMSKLSLQGWLWDFKRANRALQEITGQRPRYLRLPGDPNALLAKEVADALGMVAIGCTVNPYDFARPGERMLIERVLGQAKPGGIVLLHCGVRETVSALPSLVRALGRRFILCLPNL